MTLGEFWQAVASEQAAHPNWRLGQTAFNVLDAIRPDLSERVRSTSVDPFYVDGLDTRFVEFVQFVSAQWEVPA